MIANFNPDMPLAEIARHASRGALFFHNHGHLGSFQILERAMPEFKQASVKHFYIELPEKLFKDALKQHFTQGVSQGVSQGVTQKVSQGIIKESALEQAFSFISNKEQAEHLKALVIAAHKVGIEVLAVDINEVLIPASHLAGDSKASEQLIKQRQAQDQKIVQVMKNYAQQLMPGDKYIGLFGGNHISIGKSLGACLIILQSRNLGGERTYLHALPDQIQSGDAQTDAILKQCHIMTFVPQSLSDAILLSQPVESKNLEYLNRLLALFSLPQCKAYRHQNSEKVSAAVFIPLEDLDKIWPQIVKFMDPFSKRCDTSYDPTKALIIFDDIEQDFVRQKVVASLVRHRQGK